MPTNAPKCPQMPSNALLLFCTQMPFCYFVLKCPQMPSNALLLFPLLLKLNTFFQINNL